ncbi:GTP pyrophosphokinase family protein [Nocardioides oleivorans]|uniref:GTP pyrophosphokinase family protein n=1 Tax=Nocardioides oleivorans TaxID=273676 RepID=A0A4Q2S146_9ACTN|nr:GTP pyrophosphokinase family protein [Nocardioides oleivorans]RYB94019.1 GTP pyrophosphokinase family protein [Nocardioides oleivorans]
MTELPADPASLSPQEMRRLQQELQRFMLGYEFGLREIETKISILSDEFRHMHDYNPIEHVSSRVKSAESLFSKITRKGLPRDLDAIREHVRDVAGVRVTCSFVQDAYRIFDLLTQQEDVTVIEVKDYIREPKPNGYKSLHAIVEVPVFLSTGRQDVPVEVQLRTIAMDFWASLEHKIHYKYDGRVPADLVGQLRDAADTAQALDDRMQALHQELHGPHR